MILEMSREEGIVSLAATMPVVTFTVPPPQGLLQA